MPRDPIKMETVQEMEELTFSCSNCSLMQFEHNVSGSFADPEMRVCSTAVNHKTLTYKGITCDCFDTS